MLTFLRLDQKNQLEISHGKFEYGHDPQNKIQSVVQSVKCLCILETYLLVLMPQPLNILQYMGILIRFYICLTH